MRIFWSNWWEASVLWSDLRKEVRGGGGAVRGGGEAFPWQRVEHWALLAAAATSSRAEGRSTLHSRANDRSKAEKETLLHFPRSHLHRDLECPPRRAFFVSSVWTELFTKPCTVAPHQTLFNSHFKRVEKLFRDWEIEEATYWIINILFMLPLSHIESSIGRELKAISPKHPIYWLCREQDNISESIAHIWLFVGFAPNLHPLWSHIIIIWMELGRAEVRGERTLGRDPGGGCQRPIDLKTSQMAASNVSLNSHCWSIQYIQVDFCQNSIPISPNIGQGFEGNHGHVNLALSIYKM